MPATTNRRRFLKRSSITLASGALIAAKGVEPEHLYKPGGVPLVISTWPFGKPSNDRALEVIKAGGSALDAVERGINVAEMDPGNSSVGFYGVPNAAGVVQLDACIMNGVDHKAGAVAALEGIMHPISVARRVMEKRCT
jgi:N4-(beta-N-acetylglucosaminyl)-L-asparaginase